MWSGLADNANTHSDCDCMIMQSGEAADDGVKLICNGISLE